MVTTAILIGLFFAMNIGASGAASTMGIAYGSGVINKKLALCLCAVTVFLGAWLGGAEVVKTLGSGIVPETTFSVAIALIVLFSAALSLFIANMFGIPLSTSEVAVGAIVGAGLVYEIIYVEKLLWILFFWLITPLVAFSFAACCGYLLKTKKLQTLARKPKITPFLMALVTITGLFEAFAAGMNNVANAVGPLVGGNILTERNGVLLGGLFIAIGALLLGGRVLETNGKKITQLRLEEGSIISGTGGAIVTISSIFGIPVPLTQITTSSIIGIGFSKQGRSIFKKHIIVQLLTIWIISPFVSMVLTYSLIQFIIEKNIYVIIVVIGTIVSVIGAFLLKQRKQQKFGKDV